MFNCVVKPHCQYKEFYKKNRNKDYWLFLLLAQLLRRNAIALTNYKQYLPFLSSPMSLTSFEGEQRNIVKTYFDIVENRLKELIHINETYFPSDVIQALRDHKKDTKAIIASIRALCPNCDEFIPRLRVNEDFSVAVHCACGYKETLTLKEYIAVYKSKERMCSYVNRCEDHDAKCSFCCGVCKKINVRNAKSHTRKTKITSMNSVRYQSKKRRKQ